MEIQLTEKQIEALKKVLEAEDIEPIIQKVIDDWFNNLISLKYQATKSVSDMTDELAQ